MRVRRKQPACQPTTDTRPIHAQVPDPHRGDRPDPGVGINALALTVDGGGVQTYIRELLAGLARLGAGPALRVRVQGEVAAQLPPQATVERRPGSVGARRLLQGLAPFGGAAMVHGLDVDLPLQRGVPMVCTVHDLSVYDTPWAFSRGRSRVEQRLLDRSLRRADAVITVSHFTAERIRRRYGRTSTVVHLAPAPDMRVPDPAAVVALRARLALPDAFVLQLATVEPRKGTALLAAACRDASVPLVLAGAVRGPVPAGVRTLGYVARPDVPALYAAATVVAYVSAYEGFGLPPVEAMACGAPVVATRVGALPELPDWSDTLIRPDDLAGLTARLRLLLRDTAARDALAERGQRVARALDWDDAARGTLAVWRSVGCDAGVKA